MRRSNWLPVVGQWPMSLQDAAKAGREYIEWTDQLAKDVDFPLVAQTVELQRRIFDIADEMGVGEEVRAMVYAIRGAGYVGIAAQNLGLAPAGAAAAGLVASIGGFGAVAAAGVTALAVGLVSGLFGGGDDEAAKAKRKQRRERLEKALRELLEPVTLSTMADEQDKIASAWGGTFMPTKEQAQQGAARKGMALKLSAFFRVSKAKLSSADRARFEALINVGRWGHALDSYYSLGAAERAELSRTAHDGPKKYVQPTPDKPMGEYVWATPIVDYGLRLKAKLDGALAALQSRWFGSASMLPSGPSKAALIFGAGAVVAWAVLSPATALAAWSTASGVGSRLWNGARRLIP